MKKIIAIAVVAALSMTNVAHAAKKKVTPLFDMTQEKIENVDKTYQCYAAEETTVNDGIESKARDAILYNDAELHLKSNEDGTITAILRSDYQAHKTIMTFYKKRKFSDSDDHYFQYWSDLHNRFDGSVNGFVSLAAAKDFIQWTRQQHDEKIRVWCK